MTLHGPCESPALDLLTLHGPYNPSFNIRRPFMDLVNLPNLVTLYGPCDPSWTLWIFMDFVTLHGPCESSKPCNPSWTLLLFMDLVNLHRPCNHSWTLWIFQTLWTFQRFSKGSKLDSCFLQINLPRVLLIKPYKIFYNRSIKSAVFCEIPWMSFKPLLPFNTTQMINSFICSRISANQDKG